MLLVYFTEWTRLSVLCCAREEKENFILFLSFYIPFSWGLPFCCLLWDVGSCRWVLWGWNCGILLCVSSHLPLQGKQCFYSLCTAHKPRFWMEVNSQISSGVAVWKGSFSVEIDSELRVDCFTSLERVGGGSFVGKPVKRFWLVLCC